MKKTILSSSAEQTQLIARSIGLRLKGGEVIELISDLGGGKTTFVQGLVRGIKTKDEVSSPSFTISKVYEGKDLTVHHFDFYRLSEPGLLTHELIDLFDDHSVVVVIEWGDIVKDILPERRLRVTLKPLAQEKRELTFDYPETLSYLIFEDADTDN